MRYFIFLLVWLWAFPAQAVLLRVESTLTDVRVSNGSGTLIITYDSLRQGNDRLRAEDLQARLNALATNQQLRAGLPLLEPTRIEDPGGTFGEKFFWCDAERNPTPRDDVNGTHVCSRADVVENVFFDETGVAIVTVRRARDCAQDPTFPSCL